MALNIADLFEHAADVVPDRIAVACGDRQVTYRELDERTNRLAHHLASIGVGPRRPRRPVRAQLDRGGRDAGRDLQAARQDREHQLPVRRGRAAVHGRRRRPGRAGLRPAVRPAGRRRAAGRRQAARGRRHRRRRRPRGRRPRRRLRRRAGGPVTGPRLRPAQRRRHLPALHGRHHRLPQGRAVAAAGCLAHPRRRHRLPDRRAAGRRVGAVAEGGGGRAGQALHGAADPRQRPVGDAHGPVRRRHGRASCRSSTRRRSGARCSGTRSTCSSSSATRWPGR